MVWPRPCRSFPSRRSCHVHAVVQVQEMNSRHLWVRRSRCSADQRTVGVLDSSRRLEGLKKTLAISHPELHWFGSTGSPRAASTRSCNISSSPPRHLLDLSDVVSELQLFCSVSQRVFSEKSLPAYLRAWRATQLEEKPRDLHACSEQSLTAESSFSLGDAVMRLDFLYASPLLWGNLPLGTLDIMSELQALRGISGISPRVEVATMESLQDALLRRPELPTVLHLSAHIGTPQLPQKPQLLLEDQRGVAHAISEDALAAMASWEAEPYASGTASWLFVFLACGSQQMVEHLMEKAGLRHAICCAGDVLDAAARVFCRAFYKALAAGKGVVDSHAIAQSSVRHSANVGIRHEAALRLRAAPWAQWPQWPRVEDYASCRLIDSCRIANAFKERRVVLVLGEQGIGKSAMCREFCAYFSAPGRLFSHAAFLLDEASFGQGDAADKCKHVANVILSKIREKTPGESTSADVPVEMQLATAVKNLDQLGLWLLAVDGLSEMPQFRQEIIATLDSMLSSTSCMKLLLASRHRVPLGAATETSRVGFSGFRAAKAVELPVSPLPPNAAAKLFLRRAQRPFYPGDFDKSAAVAQPLQYEPHILERLAASPLLHTLGGIPGQIADAAVLVNSSLPSLLQHPALPPEWNLGQSEDVETALELQPVCQ
eukprot:symbB.v1.2.005859.t1/scaffold335.1/size242651/10